MPSPAAGKDANWAALCPQLVPNIELVDPREISASNLYGIVRRLACHAHNQKPHDAVH